MEGILEERIFWMSRNDSGLYESGHPLTLEQLKSEFGSGEFFDINAFLSGDTKSKTEGAFSGSDTFYVWEVSSLDELRDLMTWKDFDPEESYASKELDFEYPEFVHEDLRLGRYIYEFTGYTRDDLPVSDCKNPTVEKYAEMFGLTGKEDWMSSLAYEPTDKERAMKRIADILNDGFELTKEDYNEILEEFGLDGYMVSDKEMGER